MRSIHERFITRNGSEPLTVTNRTAQGGSCCQAMTLHAMLETSTTTSSLQRPSSFSKLEVTLKQLRKPLLCGVRSSGSSDALRPVQGPQVATVALR
jgi:hypothetical protein